MIRHACHAHGCNMSIPPKMLMCRRHWRMVPKAIQIDVWVAYVPGQEQGQSTPTEEWHKAADAAIAAVRKKEEEV